MPETIKKIYLVPSGSSTYYDVANDADIAAALSRAKGPGCAIAIAHPDTPEGRELLEKLLSYEGSIHDPTLRLLRGKHKEGIPVYAIGAQLSASEDLTIRSENSLVNSRMMFVDSLPACISVCEAYLKNLRDIEAKEEHKMFVNALRIIVDGGKNNLFIVTAAYRVNRLADEFRTYGVDVTVLGTGILDDPRVKILDDATREGASKLSIAKLALVMKLGGFDRDDVSKEDMERIAKLTTLEGAGKVLQDHMEWRRQRFTKNN